MRLTWYGHSSFLVEASDGTRIILDPYRAGAYEELSYAPIDDHADVVLASHDHDDHGAVDTIAGNPITAIHPREMQVGAVTITGIPTKHDEAGGSRRGENTVMVLDDAGFRLVHLGDLGHPLNAAEQAAVGRVDVLLIPVGGFYTIDARVAADVVSALRPTAVVPMHYRTDRVTSPIVGVDDFLATQERVIEVGSPTLELDAGSLPKERTTYVLQHAR
ncbi:MAG: MBL fold metallo-hydrolase [Actinobacteria bacterium]|nr:MBL fold metallo-hydrolase [Actinomycetota bacterium]